MLKLWVFLKQNLGGNCNVGLHLHARMHAGRRKLVLVWRTLKVSPFAATRHTSSSFGVWQHDSLRAL